MLVFTMTADGSTSEVMGAIEASYNAVAYGATINAKYTNILKKASTQVSVTSYGGPSEATEALIKSGRLSDFFNKSASLTTMVPISYTVNTLRENRLASMARTTDYVVTTYNANNTVFKYKVTMYWKILNPDDGVLDNTVECYGELRLNSERRWAIPREQATQDRNKKEKGHTIDIGDGDLNGMGTGKAFELRSDSAKPTLFQLTGFLKDHDSGSKDDTLLSFDNFPLKLEELAGKGTKTFGMWDILSAKLPPGAPKLPAMGQSAAVLCIRVDKIAS
jgi:hypothetical protein